MTALALEILSRSLDLKAYRYLISSSTFVLPASDPRQEASSLTQVLIRHTPALLEQWPPCMPPKAQLK